MTYYARFAHLKHRPAYKVGDRIKRGDDVGVMGNTGKSTGAHLHFDLVQVEPKRMYRLADIPDMITDLSALMKQYNYFLDYELFAGIFKITSYFGDPGYCFPTWIFHPAYDVVPLHNYDKIIYWNRSKNATVHMIGNDNGYGNYIILRYST